MDEKTLNILGHLIKRAKYLHYGYGLNKKDAVKQAKKEFPTDGTDVVAECRLFDIDLDTYLEGEI